MNGIPDWSDLCFGEGTHVFVSSFVVRIRPIPATKKIIPRTLKITSNFILRVPLDVTANNTAAYIRPTMPRTVSNPPKILFTFIISISGLDYLHMNIGNIAKHPEYFEEPDNYKDHHHNIQYGFDFMIHWDIGVDKP